MAANAASMVANFKSGMASGSAKYSAGVQSVTDNPAAKAAAAVADGTWAARTTAAAGKMQSKLQAVTLDAWKQAASTYGASAYAASASKAAANYAKVAPQLAQAAQQAKAAAQAIPKSDALGRVQAAMNAMKAAFGRS